MSVIKGSVSLYRTGEEKPIERYKGRLKNIYDWPMMSEFIKNIIDFLVLKDQTESFGIGSFVSQKTQTSI